MSFLLACCSNKGFLCYHSYHQGVDKKREFQYATVFLMFTKILPGSISIVVNSVVAEYKMPLSIYVVLLLLLIYLIFCHRGWKTTFF